MTTKQKIKALAKFEDCEIRDVEQSEYDDMVFDACGIEYLVCTDKEADKRAAEHIKDSAWAFYPSFIAAHTDNADKEIIAKICERCEGANDTILAMIEDIGEFADDAISSDGRGHFLSHYDGYEIEIGKFFAYRM